MCRNINIQFRENASYDMKESREKGDSEKLEKRKNIDNNNTNNAQKER